VNFSYQYNFYKNNDVEWLTKSKGILFDSSFDNINMQDYHAYHRFLKENKGDRGLFC